MKKSGYIPDNSIISNEISDLNKTQDNPHKVSKKLRMMSLEKTQEILSTSKRVFCPFITKTEKKDLLLGDPKYKIVYKNDTSVKAMKEYVKLRSNSPDPQIDFSKQVGRGKLKKIVRYETEMSQLLDSIDDYRLSEKNRITVQGLLNYMQHSKYVYLETQNLADQLQNDVKKSYKKAADNLNEFVTKNAKLYEKIISDQ